jgi:AraC family transcriptional regulator, transcriptional activator of pobA
MGDQHIPYMALTPEGRSFHIRPILRHIDPAEINEPPHRHHYQELLWINAGYGQQKVDNAVLDIKPHTFFLIAQGQIHYFVAGHDLEGFVVRFTDDFLLDHVADVAWDYRMTLFNHFALHRSLTVQPDEVPIYQRHLARIWLEQEQAAFGYMMVLRHLLGMLLIRLERTRRHLTPQIETLTDQAQIYQAFLTLLDQHFKTDTAVQFYANQLHITPRQLSSTVSHFAGRTAKQLIQDRRMLEARRYLQHTNASVKEIAYVLGFHDPSYFSKAFKQAVGVSPHQYKAAV